MVKRIDFFGQFQPTGADLSLSRELESLSRLSGQIGDLAFQEGAKIRAKQGQIEGSKVQRDAQGNLIAPEQKSDFTIFGENFNKAAVLAYRSQIAIDTKETLDKLQNDNSLDPEAFKIKANKVKTETLQGMPEELQIIAGRDFDSSIASRTGQINKNVFKLESEKQRATALDSIESATDDILNAVRNGDTERSQTLLAQNAAMLGQWVDAGTISPEEAQKLKENVAERIQQQQALKGIDDIVLDDTKPFTQRISDGLGFVDKLRKTELKDLSPEQKDSLINVVESRINDLSARAKAEKKQQDIETQRKVSNIKIKLGLAENRAKDGIFEDLSPLVEETEKLFNSGDITESERTSMLTNYQQAVDEINRITLADRRILAKIGGDQSQVTNQKDVDSFYKRNLKNEVDGLDPLLRNAATVEFVKGSRIVPTQVKNSIQNAMLSNNPDLIKEASNLVDDLQNIPGLDFMTPQQSAFFSTVTSLSESIEPAEAVKIARELTDPRDSSRIEAKTNEIKTEKYPDKYQDIVDSEFSGFFSGGPVSGINLEAMTNEYANLFESLFKAGDTKEVAENKAIDRLKQNWKESEFGFMKHRPEDFYPVAPEEMRSQLVGDLSKISPIKVDKDNVFLISDDQTSKEATLGQPTYRVFFLDENGEFQRPDVRWMPEVKPKEDLSQKAQEIRKAATVEGLSKSEQDINKRLKALENL